MRAALTVSVPPAPAVVSSRRRRPVNARFRLPAALMKPRKLVRSFAVSVMLPLPVEQIGPPETAVPHAPDDCTRLPFTFISIGPPDSVCTPRTVPLKIAVGTPPICRLPAFGELKKIPPPALW